MSGPMRKLWPSFLVSLFSGGVLLSLAIARIHWSEFRLAIEKAQLMPWLPLSVMSYLAGHVVRGVRCRALVSREASLTIPTATNVAVLGYAVNNILPARLGELARAAMLFERSGLPFVQSLTVTFLERVMDGMVLLLLLSITLPALRVQGWFLTPLRLAIVLFGVAVPALALAVASPGLVLAAASRIAQRICPRWHDFVLRLTRLVTNGVARLQRPGDASWVGILSLVVWILEAGMFLALLPAFGLPLSVPTAIFAMSVTNLGILTPSTPGFIGPFHFFCMQSMVSVGVTQEVAFGYAVLVHLTFFIPITLWGVGILFTYGLTLGRAIALRRQARPVARLPDPIAGQGRALAQGVIRQDARRASRFMAALVETLVPAQGALTEADRRWTVAFAADFVAGQIGELPQRAQVMFGAGMLFFRFATRLVYWRSYCDLPLRTRQRWLERWAHGPLALTRLLFRGVRSTALLAYYEIPAFLRYSERAGHQVGVPVPPGGLAGLCDTPPSGRLA